MARSLRIGMIGQRGVPATFGGIERVVEEVGSRLAARGHHVVVYCRPEYTCDRRDSYRGMELRYLPTPSSKHLEAFVHSGLSAGRALTENLDIVHFHALGPGLFTPLPKYLSKAKVVQTIHGLDNHRQKWGREAKTVLDIGERLSARVPDATIVVSTDLRDWYASEWSRDVHWIPNGVTPPVEPEDTSALDRLNLSRHSYVLFVGRMVPEKQVDTLIRAYKELDTNRQLVIAGGAGNSPEFEEMVHDLAASDERVIWPGYLYGDDLRTLYANAGLFVLPSSLEGLPLALLEAASWGIPIVASDIPPHLEVLERDQPGRRMFAVASEDPAPALTRAMARAMADLEGERLGAAELRRRVMDSYNWDRAVDMTEELYESLVGEPKRVQTS